MRTFKEHLEQIQEMALSPNARPKKQSKEEKPQKNMKDVEKAIDDNIKNSSFKTIQTLITYNKMTEADEEALIKKYLKKGWKSAKFDVSGGGMADSYSTFFILKTDKAK